MTRRKRSLMWDFFQPLAETKACCNLCKLNFSYKSSTSNLRKHLIRRHPTILISEKCSATNDSDIEVKTDVTKDFLEEESIFIEYCEDADENQERDDLSPKEISKRKILRIPISKKLPLENQETEKSELSFTSLEDPRKELVKIELAIAKQELELKKQQLIYAEREDNRKQKEHEITLKIKEAQLKAILNKNTDFFE
ncbi:uncharacterized protein LOC108914914 [Anoplophora glabripennis]|uniref:uncharacterized protein LOC108914914 n=1 Tax=Anoplophora glabripennis TaxID=217634 RepID=UPI0008755D3D|nr:uncharacterized protein LOC108914914 [Anoplophora glabripennis]